MEEYLETAVSPSSSSSSSSMSMSSLRKTISACEKNGLTGETTQLPDPPEPPPSAKNSVIQSIMGLADGFSVWKKYSMMDILLKMDVSVPSSQQHQRQQNSTQSEMNSATTSSVDQQQQQQQQSTIQNSKKNNFGLCRVCKDKATGIHYGIRSCEGCKGFFKRSLKKNEQYVCYFGNKCNMTPKLRKKCKLCRWKSCLEAGMSFGSMKMGRIPKRDLDRVDEDEDERNADEAASLALLDPKNAPDPRIFSIEHMCARDKENLINFLTLRNVLSMCKTHPFTNITDSTELVATSSFSDIYMNTFNENILFVLSLMRDKCTQLFAELRRPYDPYFQRMRRLRAQNLHRIPPLPQESLPPVSVIWGFVEKLLGEHVKATAAYIRELPGFSRISVEDMAIILKCRSFAVFGLRVQFLFDENNEYFLMADGIQLTRQVMSHGFGSSFTDYIFNYHDRLNKLGLTVAEIAVLCPLVVSMPGLALAEPEPLAEIHEYYKRVVLYEFSLKKRDRAFMERVNEVLSNIPENEQRCLGIVFPDETV